MNESKRHSVAIFRCDNDAIDAAHFESRSRLLTGNSIEIL